LFELGPSTASGEASPRAVRPTLVGAQPRLRGVLHKLGFAAAVPLGLVLALAAPTAVARTAVTAFAASVVAMFGVGSLYHRIPWAPVAKNRMALLDHATIYALIAGTYTPFALLVLRGSWRIPVLASVWAGALAAIAAKALWRNPPRWVAASTCVGLGWIAVPVLPQIVGGIGFGGTSLLLCGGVAYTAGALVYTRKHPDPFPQTFGYHEVFHALVVVAVVCQYATVAFFVLPSA
jgi:hemolysin III